MSTLDTELFLLRQKLAALEEQKRLLTEKKANPMKALEEFIAEKKGRILGNRYSKTAPLARMYEQEKVDMLEPVLLILKDFQQRLEALEKRK
jgi:hypothetical protein